MPYVYNTIEEYIKTMYKEIEVYRREELTPDIIASRLGFTVDYLPTRSMRIEKAIYIDERVPIEQQWEEFGHELCHALWHSENQLHCTKEFRELQERQATNFAFYACIPTSMLLQVVLPQTQCEAVHRICTLFNVTADFALERLKRHNAKMYSMVY